MKKALTFTFIIFILFAVLSPMVAFGQGTGPLPPPAQEESSGGCSFGWRGFNTAKCFNSIVAWFATLALSIAGLFLGFSGLILDSAIDQTVNFSAFLDTIPVVNIGWTIFRDLANLCFIFVLLYISISTILGLAGGNTKRMLARLVLSALLINFSLFISQAVVDASNIVTIHFYNSILAPTEKQIADGQRGDNSLSAAYMQGFKLQSIYNTGDIGKVNEESSGLIKQASNSRETFVNTTNVILISVAGSIFFVISAFVFLATSLMFLGRAIILIFLMILSPLAFVAFALPGLSGKANAWWDMLLKQSFFAPLYMMLAYVVVTAIQSEAFSKFIFDASFASTFTSGTGFSIIINFLTLIGLIVGCLVVATSIGGKTANFGITAAKTVSRGFGGRAAWVGGWAARQYLNKGSVPFIKMDKEKNRITFSGLKPTLNTKKEERVSFRDLNQKMDESAFWNKPSTKVIRERTIGALVNKKLGGYSAEETHQSDKDLKAKRERIDTINGAINLAQREKIENQRIEKEMKEKSGYLEGKITMTGEDKNKLQREIRDLKETLSKATTDEEKNELQKEINEKSETLGKAITKEERGSVEEDIKNLERELAKSQTTIEEALIRISPKEFAKYMPEDSLYDPSIMRYATAAQVKAAIENTDRGFTPTDGQEMIKAHFSEILNEVNDVEEKKIEYKKEYDKWIKSGRKGEEPKAPGLRNRIYDNIRSFETTHLGLLNLLPKTEGGETDIFRKEAFTESLRTSQVQDIRRSSDYSRMIKDEIRLGKDHVLNEARYMSYGIGHTRTDEKGNQVILTEQEKEVMMDDRKELFKKVGEDWNKFFEALPDVEREGAKAMHNETTKKGGMIDQHLAGRSPSEIAGMKGRFRKEPVIIEHFDRSILKAIGRGDKDVADNEYIVTKLYKDWKKFTEGGPAMSEANLTALDWMLNDRDGKVFYNATLPEGVEKPDAERVKFVASGKPLPMKGSQTTQSSNSSSQGNTGGTSTS
ncbi:MAG: hypothetical protein COV70_01890 [Parcubacteria group bacterium CG11_big_fil_rev_8_21_14_0_20_39_22]|nr:MAG: hypothetical protein COV70_01890 [Parcubacteria group bacterium CG11_big_fil_rev_8_21_14_0_20_39_22]